MNLASLQKKVMMEEQINQKQIQIKSEEPVAYGNEIQLYHVDSGRKKE